MRELSLFTGAGGGLLGTHHLLGFKCCGYVEWNEYCQQVIAARIRDGYLPVAPIFTDVREFVQSGAAKQYRGIADVVTAGFPCQPFSVAGKQLAGDDSRNMWPATRDCIRDVQPKSVLLENVPGLVSCGYIGRVLCDLAEMGYVGKWGVVGASALGAPHHRKRLWVVAHAESKLGHVSKDNTGIRVGCQEVSEFRNSSWPEILAYPNGTQRQGMCSPKRIQQKYANTYRSSIEWWRTDPADVLGSGVDRVANGMADGLDERLRAIGNGQVSAVVRAAWELMS